MGLRELRHPVQGLRQPGDAAVGAGEDRRRRHGAPVHRARAHRGAAHPVGPGRRLRRAQGLRGRPGHRDRHDQLEHVPGRRLQARQPDPRRPGDPAQGGRAQPRVRRRHGPDGLPRPEDLARRRHQLPGPGRHPRPAGLAGRGAADHLRPAGRAPADGAGVQVLRAGVLPHRRAGLGHVVRPRDGSRAEGVRLPRHRPPRAGDEHRVHRRAAAAAWDGWARSTSTAGSTPTTTSSSARPTRTSCSGSWSR